MLTALVGRAVRDRWITMVVLVTAVALWLVMAMAIYADIDTSLYTDLPAGLRDLMGIPADADGATLAYNVMLEFAAPLALGGVAISIGARSIAGKERDGTMGLLLANPIGRKRVLGAELAAMTILVAVATGLWWTVAELIPTVLDVELGATRLGAMHLHLAVNALFYGTLALALGAWTGNRTVASAVSAGTMAISYFAAGLIPLVDGLAGAERILPWYWFVGSEPLLNGVHWPHLALLGAGAAASVWAAAVGIERRDLRNRSVATSLLDRLRANPHTTRIFERLAGSTRVSSIWVKTTSEYQALLFVVAAVMFVVMGLLMGPVYSAIEGDLAAVGEDFPEAVMALAGNGDLSTPEGFFTVETFSLMAPAAIMTLTITIGARALAGEEADGTIGLLLANPVPRSRVVLEKALAMVVYGVALGVVIFAGTSGANLISSLSMSYADIAAASLLVTLLGMGFGTLALAVGAATGKTRVAVTATVAAAATSHLLNSFLPLDDRLAGWARLTPHHYFLGGDPLVDGLRWDHVAVLSILPALLVATAVVGFDRRDLHSH